MLVLLSMETKRGEIMTLEELKEALDNIPKTGQMNKARRLQIMRLIYELVRNAQ